VADIIERTEFLIPGPAQALAGVLGVDLPDPAGDVGLPPLWHWIYLLERPAQAVIGPDGHPTSGGLPSPPEPGRRRMFAGGRLSVHGALRTGQTATRTSFVANTAEKTGRTGRLTFVTIAHEIRQDGQLVVAEEQDIVYRDAVSTEAPASPPATAPAPAPAAPSAPADPDAWRVEADSVLLFRFSALTYNSHRIHYDREYAHDVEGYSGLVVHGPLQSILMAEMCRRTLGAPTPQARFEYKLVSPLFDHEGLTVHARTEDDAVLTEVRSAAGRVTATGRFTPSG
jgi:3-methylfumaryl-CoA hydratase